MDQILVGEGDPDLASWTSLAIPRDLATIELKTLVLLRPANPLRSFYFSNDEQEGKQGLDLLLTTSERSDRKKKVERDLVLVEVRARISG